jgi:hypothetical protein
MRFHCVARWIDSLRNALAKDESEGWARILRSLVNSEPGTYHLDNDRITATGSIEKAEDTTEDETTYRKAAKKETADIPLFT